MDSATAALTFWLKQQSHTMGNCTHAVLVRVMGNGKSHVVSKWPESYQPEQAVAVAIKEVLQKKRLHLASSGEHHMLLAQPILQRGQLWGAVVLNLHIEDKKNLPTSVKRLQSGMAWLAFLLAQHDTSMATMAKPSDAKDVQTMPLLHMVNGLLKENSLQETAISLVNFLATHMHVSRVSLGLQDKKGIELIAVSFSATFDKRTAAMQAITHAMDEAVDQRMNIHYGATATTHDAAPIIQRCHKNLLDVQKVIAVDSFLLRKNTQIIGVITLEDSHNAIYSHEKQAFIAAALSIICDVISLKQHNEKNIRQQIKSQTAQKLTRWLGAKKLTGKLISAGALLALCILFFPANYWIASDAHLQSTYKYLVVSPQDGYLTSIKVSPGTQVKKGELLAQLNDDDLRLERRKLFSQMQQSQQEYDNALANANRVQAAIANEKVTQANAQLSLIEQQQLHTQLVSPSDGIITSDDITQSLGAPVKQGQMLFEVAANKGYLIQLLINEKNIAGIKVGQKGEVKLTSLPGELFAFTVKSITPVSEIREGENYFRVDASMDRESDLLRPGMTGSGKILAGRELLGWIWFHDVWHWLRLKLWL